MNAIEEAAEGVVNELSVIEVSVPSELMVKKEKFLLPGLITNKVVPVELIKLNEGLVPAV